MDDALEADDGEQTAAHSGARNETQDDYAKQAPRVPAGGLLQELPFLDGSHGEKQKLWEERRVSLVRPRHGAFSRAIMSTRCGTDHRRFISPTFAHSPNTTRSPAYVMNFLIELTSHAIWVNCSIFNTTSRQLGLKYEEM